jgi:AcrR family transcriptional regulator
MPSARESLLASALSAVRRQPWTEVRMVDVAESAGVSRQTLYNEFGSKDGLSRALIRSEVDAFLSGVESALAHAERAGADAGDCFAAAADWTLRATRDNPLVRCALTGERDRSIALMPGSGRPTPTELVGLVRDRAVGAIEHGYPKLALDRIGAACEAAVRLTLSYAVAPAPTVEEASAEVARLVRGLLDHGW